MILTYFAKYHSDLVVVISDILPGLIKSLKGNDYNYLPRPLGPELSELT